MYNSVCFLYFHVENISKNAFHVGTWHQVDWQGHLKFKMISALLGQKCIKDNEWNGQMDHTRDATWKVWQCHYFQVAAKLLHVGMDLKKDPVQPDHHLSVH